MTTAGTGARTVGVEEEFLLVDPASGVPRSVATTVLGSLPSDQVEGELQRTMVEIQSAPSVALDEVREELTRTRHTVAVAAREAGVAVVALGTSPLAGEGPITNSQRYQRMLGSFGPLVNETLTCGTHVHVGIDSDELGVAVLDRIRVWLPVVAAVAANSPFWHGEDSGYASYRTQVWSRWPSSGPAEVFGSAAAYHRVVDALVGSGVLLDRGMVYWDARLSHRYPTVEIRVADVCTDLDDTMTVAALCRALVETAAVESSAGVEEPAVPAAVLRMSSWRASHDGCAGQLLDPGTMRPQPAAEVVRSLVAHVRAALSEAGDLDLVEAGVGRVLADGNGAVRQRRTVERTGSLVDVVAAAALH